MNNYNNNDFIKAQMHAALATEKLPALNETIKFIFDVCYGRRTEISTETINDAFDCVDNRDKAIIYLKDLTQEEKEKEINQAEIDIETRKQMLSSFLSFKKVKYKQQQYSNLHGNNNIINV